MNFKSGSTLLIIVAILSGSGSTSALQRKKRPGAISNTAKPQSQEAPAQAKTQSMPGEVERISVEDLKGMIAKKQPVTIIDARSASSWDSATTKIKGAIRMDVEEIPSRLKELPLDREIVIYCA
ncbi:MAG: rhodanese-like domain-containing protein [Blastocatellia bacterium]